MTRSLLAALALAATALPAQAQEYTWPRQQVTVVMVAPSRCKPNFVALRVSADRRTVLFDFWNDTGNLINFGANAFITQGGGTRNVGERIANQPAGTRASLQMQANPPLPANLAGTTVRLEVPTCSITQTGRIGMGF